MASLTYKNGPSKHFTWREVNPRSFKGMNPLVRGRAIAQARRLEKLRTEINKRRKSRALPETGISVLSWWRPAWYNKRVHGAVNSRHIKGDATDFSLTEIVRLMPWEGGRKEFDRLCEEIWPNGGVGTYAEGSRHTDSRGWRARWTTFVGQ